MFKTTAHLLSLIRFSHTLFALPFALAAAVMAWWLRGLESQQLEDPILYSSTTIVGIIGTNWTFTFDGSDSLVSRMSQLAGAVRWQELVGILLCMVFARSAAMAFNRLVDRRIDAANPRTAGRHLPAGVLSTRVVTLFALGCAVGFVASTLLFLPNWLPLLLSVPVLAWLCGYSLAKRFTSLAHFWLGAALALSPVAAWIAIRGEVVLQDPLDLLPSVVLGGAVLLWVAGFDILYACQDYEYDTDAKLHSVPVALGLRGALRLAAACHAGTVLLLAALPVVYPPLGAIYWLAIACVALLLIYEHWLVGPDDLERVNLAFFHVNAVISVGLLVATCVDLILWNWHLS